MIYLVWPNFARPQGKIAVVRSPRAYCFGVFTLLFFLLSGCVTAPANAPRFTPAAPAPEGYATVYVYRLGAPPYSGTIKFSMAGKLVFEASEQAYTWFYIRAGTHALFAQWPTEVSTGLKKWPDVTAAQDFTAGRSYFYRINANAASTGLLSSNMVLTTKVSKLSNETGQAELSACCRYLPPMTQQIE
jgi:hypothetical protein